MTGDGNGGEVEMGGGVERHLGAELGAAEEVYALEVARNWMPGWRVVGLWAMGWEWG